MKYVSCGYNIRDTKVPVPKQTSGKVHVCYDKATTNCIVGSRPEFNFLSMRAGGMEVTSLIKPAD